MTVTYLAYELNSGSPIDEIPFTDFRWDDAFLRPGGFTASLPMRHPKALRENLREWKTAIWVDTDGVLQYAGVITSVDVKLDDSPTVNVSGLGVLSYYREGHRTLQSAAGMTYGTASGDEIRFAAVDQFRIVEDLIDHAHSFTGGDPWGLTVNMNGGLSGVTRDRTYKISERKSIGELIEQLAAVNDGFDFSMGYSWVAGAPTVALDLWYPRRGRDLEVVLEEGKNIEFSSYKTDGNKQMNKVLVLGAGDGSNQLTATATATAEIYPTGSYPLLEGVATNRDVSIQTTLNEHATALLYINKVPRETMTIGVIEIPELTLGAFVPGDTVLVYIDDHFLQVDGRYRIQSISVAIDEAGQRNVSCALASVAPSEVEDA